MSFLFRVTLCRHGDATLTLFCVKDILKFLSMFVISFQCLFSIDHGGGFYVHGQKHYVLTVVKISNRVKEEDK